MGKKIHHDEDRVVLAHCKSLRSRKLLLSTNPGVDRLIKGAKPSLHILETFAMRKFPSFCGWI